MNSIWGYFGPILIGVILAFFIGFFSEREEEKVVLDVCVQKQKGDEMFDCFDSKISKLVYSQGPAAAVTAIRTLQRQGVFINPVDCHMLMHYVGRAAYAQFHNVHDARAAVGEQGIILCSGGYEHAIVSFYFDEMRDKKTAEGLAKESCGSYYNSTESWFRKNCFHSIGHALLVLERNPQKALEFCGKLPQSWQQHYCGTGVIMEYWFERIPAFAQHATSHKHNTPGYSDLSCGTVAEQWKKSCYSFLAVTSFAENGGTYKTALDHCRDLREEEYRTECYTGTGTSYVIGGSGESFAQIQRACSEAVPAQYASRCAIRSMKIYFVYHPEIVRSTTSKEFCESFENKEDKEFCGRLMPPSDERFFEHGGLGDF